MTPTEDVRTTCDLYSEPCPKPPTETRELSRQRKWQLKNKSEGLCPGCGNKPSAFCEKHTARRAIADNPPWFRDLLTAAKAEGIEIGRKQKGNSGRLMYQDGYKDGVKAMQERVTRQLLLLISPETHYPSRCIMKSDVDRIADQLLHPQDHEV